ncbi:uncharacterized protein LOC109830948 [Asparagus officinalis]|uniref:uncharacterized protein LOC109830948 n=1 Tax=Asparagus officinalis TaxID=4686 RepID=UPI00098E0599|nr:uncharacterized protein LOC109830948 [Asparagus officinalis]
MDGDYDDEEDCIDMIDETHVDAMLPASLVACFIGRKGVTQNILIACKYYLCNAGYTTIPDFISPHCGVRYHLKEFTGRTSQNRRELFNLRHSSLRSKIEATFGILYNRFKILTVKPHYPFPAQVDIILACTVLHYYIATVDPNDDLLNKTIDIEEDDVEEAIDEETNVMEFTQSQTQREQNASKDEWKSCKNQIALDMWIDYCNKYQHGITTESAL